MLVTRGARLIQADHIAHELMQPGQPVYEEVVHNFGRTILNPDGSEAEKSGNGLRIFAKYLWDHGYVREPVFTVDTKGGRVECHCHVVDGRMNLVTVELGRCTFKAPEIPMNGPDREVVKVPLQVGGETLLVTAVSVGNPHCVVFVNALDESRCKTLGPQIENHPAFPNRTNVQFARVGSRTQVDILIWERGAGYTLASGSSSCGERPALSSATIRWSMSQPITSWPRPAYCTASGSPMCPSPTTATLTGAPPGALPRRSPARRGPMQPWPGRGAAQPSPRAHPPA